MKKILLGILITGIFAYGGDPLVAKRLEQNVKQCYKQSPEVHRKANTLLGSALRIGILGKYGETWENFVLLINSADEFRTAMLEHCDKEVKNAILNTNGQETIDLLKEFTDYAFGI